MTHSWGTNGARPRRRQRARALSRRASGGLLVVALAALSGCGDGGSGASGADLVEGVTVDVGVLDNTFRPETVDVAAGTVVVWENGGRNDHNVLPTEGDDWGVEVDEIGRASCRERV